MDNIFDKKVIGFEYIPQDGEDWVVDRVVMKFSDESESDLYLYGGRFFWHAFQSDERDIYSGYHSRKFLNSLMRSGNVFEAFEFMMNLHINLVVKIKSLDLKLKSPMGIRKSIFNDICNNEELLKEACKVYFKYLNECVCRYNTNISLDDFCTKVFDRLDNNLELSAKDCVNEFTLPLNELTFKDVQMWGDICTLNTSSHIKLYKTGTKFYLELVNGDSKFRSDIFDFSIIDEEEDMPWLVVTTLFNLIRNASHLDKELEVEGLLYDRSVVDKDCVKDEVIRHIVRSKSHTLFRYNLGLADILSELLMFDMHGFLSGESADICKINLF